MRKNVKKFLSLLLAVAVMAGCMAVPSIDAQAATKNTTLKYDKKKGVVWETAIRSNIKSTYSNYVDVYLMNEGDYVASVKSSSKNMVVKNVYFAQDSGNISSHYSALDIIDPKLHCKGYSQIQCYTKKAGTYNLTITIKNAQNKQTCKKTVKVYANNYATPIEYLSYGGTRYYVSGGSSIQTKKASGKLKYKANPTYSVTSMQIATTFNAKGEPVFKKVRNGKNITLAKTTKYSQPSSSYSSTYYSYTSSYEYDYLKPMTIVRIAYRDKVLGTTETMELYIFNIK